MAYGGAGTLFVLAGGVFSPVDLALAADDKLGTARLGKPLFVQISDTHTGFNKDANPDVNGTLTQTIDLVNGMSSRPPSSSIPVESLPCRKPANLTGARQMFPVLARTGCQRSGRKTWWPA